MTSMILIGLSGILIAFSGVLGMLRAENFRIHRRKDHT